MAKDSLLRTKIATDRQNSALAKQAKDYASTISHNEALAREAGGIRGQEGYLSAMANAKKTASKFVMDDINNIKDTMSYDDATDNAKLLSMIKDDNTTLAARVAYTQRLSKNGGPGVETMRKAFLEAEQKYAGDPDKLLDFKEYVATDSSILGTGKDVEFWLVNTRDRTTNDPLSFTTISNDPSTWTNLTANAFASQNVSTHHHALTLLHNQPDKSGYMGVINMIRNNPGALAQVKQGVREKYSIYSDAEIEEAAHKGITLPPPGTIVP